MAEGDNHGDEFRRHDQARRALTRNNRMRIYQEAAARFQLDSLTGRSVAEARAIVEAAGGTFVDLGSDEPITADVRTDRVLAETSRARVVDAWIA